MPIEISERSYPSGETYLYVVSSGSFSVADAEALVARLDHPDFAGQAKVLSTTLKGTDYPLETRRFLFTDPFNYRWMANVVTSPLVRASINMMLRLAPGQTRYKMFTDEDKAAQWLREQP